MTKHKIEIHALPLFDLVCQGTRRVPNVFDQPIQKARVSLRAAGWRPAKIKPPVYTVEPDGSLNIEEMTHFSLYKDGITEVEGCGGSSGFCGFVYRSGRAKMDVTTLGEKVISYSVTCGDRAASR